MMQAFKNPIKNLPVRQPGQSSREKVDKIFDDEVLPYFMSVVVAAVMAMLEWYKAYSKTPPQPIAMTVVFAIVLLFTARKAFKVVKKVQQVKLGELGEQAVGQMLEEKLRPMGCQVFHDILGDNFNVDHFVAGPTGLFCVETKTHRKPAKGDIPLAPAAAWPSFARETTMSIGSLRFWRPTSGSGSCPSMMTSSSRSSRPSVGSPDD